MHETVICKKIQDEAIKLSNKKTIKSITLEVGELGPLPPEELKHHLITLTNWEVKLIIKKAKANCVCGFTGNPTIMERGHDYCIYFCPKCGKAPELKEGKDIIIKEVVV